MFYVYAYLHEDGTPYYIGKGSSRRAWKPHGKIPLPTDRSRIVIMEDNLSEIGAFALERRYIRWYGRKSIGTGILENLSEGGEGPSGYVFTEDHKEKLRKARVGKTPNPKGLNGGRSGGRSGGWSGPKPEEWKQRMRKPKGPQSLEHRMKISEANKRYRQKTLDKTV